MSSPALCVNCSIQFTFFKRKNRCSGCRLLYCSNCIKKGESLPRRNIKQCLKCHALSSQPFIRSELMLLSVKELKTFLEQKNVSSAGCAEKGDLVDVIINYQARPQLQTSQVNETRTNQAYVNAPHANEPQPSTSGSASESQAQSHSFTRNQSEGINNFFGTLQINPEIHSFVTNMFQLNESGISGLRPSNHDELNNSHSSRETSYNSYQHRMPYEEDDRPSCVYPTQVKTRSKISLQSLKGESDIRKLSAKELKVLLDDNFVDYKGCVEKEELVQRLLMLWQSKNLQENAAASMDESPATGHENEVCKVCMDRVIDCVFLECGHLVTCVDCGRQLRECPLCRQNIARIVRVFKS